jgi:MFS family permease
MLALLSRRDFALVWIAGLISIAGNRMLFVALPLHVYALTGSTLATATMSIAAFAPRIVLGPVAGVYVDRWDKRRTMVWANAARALIILPLLLARSPDLLWVVYAVTAIETAIGTFFGPAEHALLPRLVGEERLVAANALNALNNNIALLVGPAVGGILFAVAGLAGVVLVDVATYLIGAILLARITTVPRLTMALDEDSPIEARWNRLRSDMLDGLGLIRQSRTLVVLLLVSLAISLGEGLSGPLVVPFATDVLGGDEVYLGVLFSVQALGALPGGMLIARYGSHLAPAHLLGVGLLAQGLIDLALANARDLAPPGVAPTVLALVLVFLFGIPSMGWTASYQTLLQRGVAAAYRGRVFGAVAAGSALVHLVGFWLGGLLGELIGVVPVLTIGAGLGVASGVIALALLPSNRRKRDP